jgi:hypothetical protein
MSVKQSSQWSLVKFLTTLNSFGEIPFLGSYRWVQQLTGQRSRLPGMTMQTKKRAIAVGSPFSKKFDLLQQRLPASVELIFRAAESVPAEAEPRLEAVAEWRKLLQLADVIVVLDIPEKPEYLGVLSDIAAYLQNSSGQLQQRVFDFSQPNSDLSAWIPLDDGVMGGVSQGQFFLRAIDDPATDDSATFAAVFAGNVSTDNSGGFSSVRTQNFEPPFNFAGWQGMRLRVKGDGQRYKFIARNSDGWDSPAYIYSFDTTANTWISVDVPFEAMIPTFRARSVPSAPPFDPQKVFSFQLMLSKFEFDRQLNPRFTAGPFELAVSDIAVYRPRWGCPLVVMAAQDETIRRQQQAILSKIDHRLIEPADADWASTIAATLVSSL